MKHKGFTLVEILLSTTIICIVAVLVLPVVIEGFHNNQYETGLKKAINIVGEAISLNIAKGERSAYYTNSSNPLYFYLQKNINTSGLSETSKRNSKNAELYTADNMRFEFPKGTNGSPEFQNIKIGDNAIAWSIKDSNCGTYGLKIGGNSKIQNTQPCVILVDVNGDKGPNELTDTKLKDMFLLIVTDKSVIPYGQIAQQIHYNNKD